MIKKLLVDSMLVTFGVVCISCSGTTSSSPASGPVTPSSVPVAIEFLDGATGVGVSAEFAQTYSHEVDSATVTTDTVFIVQDSQTNLAVPLKSFDAAVCNAASKLPASVALSSDKKTITLTPSSSLGYSTSYSIGLSGVKYTTGTQTEDTCVSFTTQEADSSASLFISDISTDAYYDINLSTTPLAVTFTGAMTADSPNNFLVSGNRTSTIPGTWGLDSTSKIATFTPTSAVPVCDLIYVTMPVTTTDASGNPFGSISNTSFLTAEFTTLYSYNSDFTDTSLQSNFATCWTESSWEGVNFQSFGSEGLVYTGRAPYDIGAPYGNSYYWEKTITDTKITATLHIKSLSLAPEEGYTTRGGVGLMMWTSSGNDIEIIAFRNNNSTYFATKTDMGGTSISETSAISGNEVWLRIQRNNTVFTPSYSTNGVDFTALSPYTNTVIGGTNGADYKVAIPLYFESGAENNLTAEISSMTFTW